MVLKRKLPANRNIKELQSKDTVDLTKAEVKKLMEGNKSPRDKKSKALTLDIEREITSLNLIKTPVKHLKLYLLKRRLTKIKRAINNFYLEEIKLGVTDNNESKKRIKQVIDLEKSFDTKIIALEQRHILPNGFFRRLYESSKK